MAAVVYLLPTMRVHRLTPARLTVAAGFYLVFAFGLIPILDRRITREAGPLPTRAPSPVKP